MSLPFCACRCGQRVLHAGRRWLAGHVPTSVKAAGARTARRNFAYRRRRIAFDDALRTLQAHGSRVTTEALLEAFSTIDRTAYHRGYRACEDKWTGRASRGGKQAA